MARKPRPLGVPAWLAAGLHRAEKERKASILARPMRQMFALLATGEVLEIDGHAVMRMPEIDDGVTERAQWCAIAPAIRGWIDCWQRIAPDLGTYHLQVLADCLGADKPITPRLVEQARDEFESTIRRIVELPDGAIHSAILTTQIAWEFERQAESTTS
jgi:hypothetical protein